MRWSRHAPEAERWRRARPRCGSGSIEEALRLDLVGPGPEPDGPGADLAEELLRGRERPSNWYLTGFLVPDQTPPAGRADPDEDDDSTGEVAEDAGLLEESVDEHRAAKRGFFPSSMGLSFLVPEAARELEVVVSWGDYAAAELPPATPGENPRPVWRRTPRRERLDLALGPTTDERIPVPGARGLELHRVERALAAGEVGSAVPDATRAVSLFLVNRRTPVPDRSADAFQAGIEVRCAAGFLGRPQTGGGSPGAWDEEVANLHYRPDSDVDVLAEFKPGVRFGLFELVDMRDELSAIVGRKAEIFEFRALRPWMQEEVAGTTELFYESPD